MANSEKIEKPKWLKVRAPVTENYADLKAMFRELNLATVCQEARCPNIGECWAGGTATIMILGDTCTRACRFCAVKTGNPKGVVDTDEPEKVGYAVSQMDLEYVVLTAVDRDDLPDDGADHFGRTVETIKKNNPQIIVEVLTGDFNGRLPGIKRVVDSRPDVFAHNIETVERLTPEVRDAKAGYRRSLFVLERAKTFRESQYTKSSIMLGLGERKQEIKQSLIDLRNVGCDVVTFGQYLQPTRRHLRVQSFVHPDDFKEWQNVAEGMGFLYVASGPLVRSSYRAGEFFMKGVIEKQRKLESGGISDGKAEHRVT